jgi:hypothetical protein
MYLRLCFGVALAFLLHLLAPTARERGSEPTINKRAAGRSASTNPPVTKAAIALARHNVSSSGKSILELPYQSNNW